MKDFIVLLREHDADPLGAIAFECKADGMLHAEEQCLNAYPGADVLFVYEGTDQGAAWEAWGNGL